VHGERKTKACAFYSCLAVVGVIALITIGGAAWLAYRVATDGPGPGFGFRYYTGLEWPAEARVLRRGDTHGGFHGDGEYCLVCEVDDTTLQKWLARRAPWSDWQRGPVPGEIGYHCSFGGSGVMWGDSIDSQHYSGDEELVKVLSSDQVWYSARERGAGSLRWHNGDLIVLDVRSRRIWLSAWDF